MKTICYSALLLALILLVPLCLLRKEKQADHPNESAEGVMVAREEDTPPVTFSAAEHSGPVGENLFSADDLLAMNSPYARQSKGLYDRLRSVPTEGMKIGKPHMTIIKDGQNDTIDWHTRTRFSDNTHEQAAKLLNVPEGSIPKDFYLDDIVLSASGKSAIVSSGGVGSASYLLKSRNGHFDVRIAQPLPAVNYDDKVRRWTIRWEAFLTDQLLLGVMSEPDVEIENPVRVHYYLYNVPNSTLSRLIMPKEMEGDDPAKIEATSDNAVLIHHGGSYHTVVIQDAQ